MKAIYHTVILLLIVSTIVSCGDAPYPDDYARGKEVLVSFELPDVSTRSATSAGLSPGVQFKVYAYNQAISVAGTTAPLAEGAYKVSDNGNDIEAVSDKSLKLYAGVYDFYFVSYNASDKVPAVSPSSSTISNIGNETDFLYAAMKNVGVRSTNSGENTFFVKLEVPFSRLCSAMKISVKAKDGTQPVTPTLIAVKNVVVTGLSGSGSFTLGSEALEITGTAQKIFGNSDFNTPSSVAEACTSKNDYLLLPTNGGTLLDFAVTLTVGYDKTTSGGTGVTPTTEDFDYKISLTKALLAGIRYEFAFTLTFYDHYLPGDLELDVLPFVEVPPLDTGVVGD